MFKKAIVYYPTDERILKQIARDISAFHCAAAVKYMDVLKLNEKQKIQLVDSVLQDMTVVQPST